MAGCVEGAADQRGQLGELGGGLCGETMSGRWAVIGEADMQVSPRVKRGTAGRGEGVQVGSSCGKGSGSARCRGKEGGGARFGGKVGDAKAPKA
jgi:hypothetical protein